MKALLFAAIFSLLLAAPAFAMPSGEARTVVYVFDPPKASVLLEESQGTLVCSWDIADNDVNDSFRASVAWTRDGENVTAETVDCGQLRHCAALERPVPSAGEDWKCNVSVTDSYGASGSGSAEFQMTPLSFFGGLLKNILSFFNLA